MMQAERRDRLLPPRNDNHRPSIHSKTAALLREQHAGGSQTARPIAVDERSSADPARSRRTTAISREPAARCGGTHGRRHAPAMGEGQGPTPWLFSSTKRPIHEKKGGEATTTLFFSCWVGFLMTTHVVTCRFLTLLTAPAGQPKMCIRCGPAATLSRLLLSVHRNPYVYSHDIFTLHVSD